MEHVSSSSVTLVEFHDPQQQQKQKQRSLIPEKWEDHVRTLGISEYKEAALSLSQAFATDELAQYLLDADDMAGLSDEAKWRLHVDIMKYIVAAHCYKGIVTTIGEDYEGVALCMPPGSTMDDWMTIIRSGMWRLYYQLTAGGRKRYYDELLPLLHDTKLEVMGERDDDCYYLVYLGTKPSGRRRGYARKLIEHMAAKADAEGRAIYLESSSLKNNVYYKKFGFEVKKDIFLGDTTTTPTPITSDSSSSRRSSSIRSDVEDDDKGSGSKKRPVQLTIMVREPQKLAKSIPIKLMNPGLMMMNH